MSQAVYGATQLVVHERVGLSGGAICAIILIEKGEGIMTDFKLALHDPAGVFKNPEKVVENKSLTTAQKVKILRQWEYDLRDALVAEEENMPAHNGDQACLQRVLIALRQLGVESDVDHSPPTKHGGESA